MTENRLPLLRVIGTRALAIVGVGTVTAVLSGVFTAIEVSSIVIFVLSAIALAALVRDGTEQLGTRLGPGARGWGP
jgi:Ca2+/H+ antiporter